TDEEAGRLEDASECPPRGVQSALLDAADGGGAQLHESSHLRAADPEHPPYAQEDRRCVHVAFASLRSVLRDVRAAVQVVGPGRARRMRCAATRPARVRPARVRLAGVRPARVPLYGQLVAAVRPCGRVGGYVRCRRVVGGSVPVSALRGLRIRNSLSLATATLCALSLATATLGARMRADGSGCSNLRARMSTGESESGGRNLRVRCWPGLISVPVAQAQSVSGPTGRCGTARGSD